MDGSPAGTPTNFQRGTRNTATVETILFFKLPALKRIYLQLSMLASVHIPTASRLELSKKRPLSHQLVLLSLQLSNYQIIT